MSSIVISGDTSGSVTLQAPAVAGSTVITLPSTSTTLVSSQWTTSGANIFYNTGSVGVGAAPDSTFYVGGGALGTIRFFYNGTSVNYNDVDLQIWRTAGASEIMRLNSTGLGIGTSSPSTPLHILSSAQEQLRLGRSSTASSAYLTFYANNSSSAQVQYAGILGDVIASTAGSQSGALIFFTTNTGTSAERVRIDSSGQLGIGTTSANATLHAQGATTTDGSIKFNQQLNSTGAYNATPMSGTMVALKYNSGGDYAGMGGWSIGKENATDGNYSSYFAMHTRANGGAITERARIDSSGKLLVATTTVIDSARMTIKGSATVINAQTETDGSYVLRVTNAAGSGVGGVVANSSSTSYLTSSDYRLKNTIAPMTGALAKVALLKPSTYKWNADGSDGEGFIAHELAEVCPYAVIGEKDAVDSDGNIKSQGIDTSFLVATLTAAIQEQQALITTLTDRITALEGV